VSFWRKLFGGAPAQPQSSVSEPPAPVKLPPAPRHSTGLCEFLRALGDPSGQVVLDLGPTSPKNIQFITSLGCRSANVDLVAAARDTSLWTPPAESITAAAAELRAAEIEAYLNANLRFADDSLDAVLLWDICDYLPEELVRAVIDRLRRQAHPGAPLLCFFHTKEADYSTPYLRYHITGAEHVELQPGPDYKLQRCFANRHVEKLFADFHSYKFFLGKDNVREVLITR